jgi:tungstate transport system substrate-binding protein
MVRLAVAVLIFFSSAVFPFFADAAPAQKLTLATTTSTQFTGLLDWLHPRFEKRYGVRVHTIAVGTGKALRLGRDGDVDVVLVHAPEAEKKFVSRGYGVNRRSVMFNDFVIVGPENDPAKISGMGDAAAALRWVSARGALWASRGDDSGTYKKEMSLWRAAGILPKGSWYLSLGQGMGYTLRLADEKGAYTLVDRGSYLFFAARGKVDLKIVSEGDKRLLNPYGVIAVNPKRHPHVKYDLAMKYVTFLTSPEGQKLIGSFRVKGKKLFHPFAGSNAGKN